MQVLILCGGIGTRLRTLTRSTPKSMMLVAGKPFLEYLIEFLNKNRITEITLCTGYLHNKIEDYFGNGKRFGVKIQYSREYSPLGTAGAIKNAEKLIKNRFFVLNGDSYLNLNLNYLKKKHLQKKAMATIALTRVKKASRFGRVTLDRQGRILDFSEKGLTSNKKSNYINAGIYLLDKSILKLIPEETCCSLEKEIFPKLLRRRFYGYKCKGFFVDIGTPETYYAFNKIMKEAQK